MHNTPRVPYPAAPQAGAHTARELCVIVLTPSRRQPPPVGLLRARPKGTRAVKRADGPPMLRQHGGRRSLDEASRTHQQHNELSYGSGHTSSAGGGIAIPSAAGGSEAVDDGGQGPAPPGRGPGAGGRGRSGF